MQTLSLIALGGAAGAVSRHLVGRAAFHLAGPGWPLGTLAVNLTGALLMGALIGWLAATDRPDGHAVRVFAATGFLGGFTTFSAFSLELVRMIERKAWIDAFLYASGSVLVSIAALFAGLWLVRRLYA